MKKKIKEYFGNFDKITKADIILFSVIFAVMFLIFLWGDLLLTTRHGISFFDLLLKGDLYNFYKANFETGTGFFTGVIITYDIPIFIIFSIWNIPIWIYTKLSTIPWETQFLNVIWAKMILVFFLAASCVVIYKILEYFKIKDVDKKIGIYLYVSSPLVLMVIALFGGYDIISVFFTLLGIYYYIKIDNKKFILFFTIAISLKLFALFVFIPLLLLNEKRIMKIGLSSFITLIPTLLSKIIYHNAPKYYESMNWFEDGMLDRIMSSKVTSPFNGISIFVTLMVLLCIYCYAKNLKNDKEKRYFSIYIPLIVYSIFITFVAIHPQWLILIIPYMILLIIINKQDRRINLMLDTAFGGLYLLLMNIWYPSVFSPYIIKMMLLEKIFKLNNKAINTHIFDRFQNFSPVINAMIVAALLAFIYINNPIKLIKNEKEKEKEKFNRLMVWTRLFIIIPFAAVIVYFYFKG